MTLLREMHVAGLYCRQTTLHFMTQQYPLLSRQGTTPEEFAQSPKIVHKYSTKTNSTFYDSSNHVYIKEHL